MVSETKRLSVKGQRRPPCLKSPVSVERGLEEASSEVASSAQLTVTILRLFPRLVRQLPRPIA